MSMTRQLTDADFSAFDPRGMFFRKSPYVHSRDARPARVLALYSGTFIGEIRLKPYLNALLGRGIIADYQIADRVMTMEGQSGPYAFTHIWCQRNVSTAQFAFLKAHSRCADRLRHGRSSDIDPRLRRLLQANDDEADRLVSAAGQGGHGRDRQAARLSCARMRPPSATRSSCSRTAARSRTRRNGAADAEAAGLDLQRRSVLPARESAVCVGACGPAQPAWLRGGADRTLRCEPAQAVRAVAAHRPSRFRVLSPVSAHARRQPSPSRRCRRGCRHRRNAISMQSRT